MREIITLQIGPFANWAGSHFWNVQDDARHPTSFDEAGDPLYEDEQADAPILYRSQAASSGRGRQLTPRLVLCDSDDGFGSLSSSGEANRGAVEVTVPPAGLDALSWGGSVHEVVQEQRAAHAFVQMMHAPLIAKHDGSSAAAYSGYADEYHRDESVDDDVEYDSNDNYDDDEDGRTARMTTSPPRRSGVGQLAGCGVPAAGRRHEQSCGAAHDTRAPRRSGDTSNTFGGTPAVNDSARRASETRGEGEGGEAAKGDVEEELRAVAFAFERSVDSWSDYLQARLHPRSLAPLQPHAHGYSALARFPDGACIIEREEDTPGGPGLVERVRRFLEECDTLQGFHLLCDADSGFGGAAAALLTQLRDDYTHAPCLALGLGTLARPARSREAQIADAPLSAVPEGLTAFGAGGVTVGRDGYGAHTYTPALNDALSLSAFADLQCAYVPLYGSGAMRAALDQLAPQAATAGSGASPTITGHVSTATSSLLHSSPTVNAPPLLQPCANLRYHTSAPVAALLDAVTMPYRAKRPKGNLQSVVAMLCPQRSMFLSSAVLGLPVPQSPPLLERDGWLAPLLPFQRPPHAARAFAQHISWLGYAGGARAVAPLLPQMLPCRGDGGSLFARPQPFALPLSFPQFFDVAVGAHGELVGASSHQISRHWHPSLPVVPPSALRFDNVEVLDVPLAAALQSSTAIHPALRRVAADWATEAKAAERAAAAEGWAARDELGEVTEHLATLCEVYSDGDFDVSGTSGFSSAD